MFPAMDPTNPADHPITLSLAPKSQRACYLPWLKVSVASATRSRSRGHPEAWQEVRQNIPWLLDEQSRIRKAGWFN